ncbi:hypothetical protein MYP_1191 [Sporocytophaga myxococcoides]|uniref:Uncharacterized protein n=1 Tax=Sporocytophaga myxococcoides TaxID=153721 RepID=A0A098LCQ7_9BACT|nr:hypothetical protein MYP_1191 [Sporocytophaga myxococcoides]
MTGNKVYELAECLSNNFGIDSLLQEPNLLLFILPVKSAIIFKANFLFHFLL